MGTAGKLEVTVPVPAGTPVEVVVLAPTTNEFADLVKADPSGTRSLSDGTDDMFAEMEPFTVKQMGVDDSRESIYQRQVGE